MGQKINATSIRLKITDTWKSRWLKRGDFPKMLRQDVMMREFLLKTLKKSGVARVDIERFGDSVIVTIKTTKPGMIIGKGGGGAEELKKKVLAHLNEKIELKLNIEEVKDINLQAQVIAQNIAEQIEKRIAYRRAMKQAVEQVMEAGALGVRIETSGRLAGADIAREERMLKGKVPLHTLRANIDFARVTAFTTYGTIGIKVWINKGEVFSKPQFKI
jgi:small subunit ribosomal protein S3